jgi:hypothetical protein
MSRPEGQKAEILNVDVMSFEFDGRGRGEGSSAVALIHSSV